MAGFVDADTHVVEGEEAWSYADSADQRYMPRLVEAAHGGAEKFWVVDGQVLPADGFESDLYEEGTRDLRNVAARIRDMDRLGVETQVLFPSVFLRAVFEHAEVQVAVCRSYNRWLADVCAKTSGRIRWGIVPPLLDLKETIAELEFGKEHGACGVVLRGIEVNRLLTDPYFDPLYEAAGRLDLALSVHIGSPSRSMGELSRKGGVMLQVTQNILAFHTLISSDIPERFPDLRFGFLESGSQWLPFALQEARRASDRLRGYGLGDAETLNSLPLYVACQVDDDLSYVLDHYPHDKIVIGTDYGHSDIGFDMEGHRLLKERDDVDPAILDQIVSGNGRALYGL